MCISVSLSGSVVLGCLFAPKVHIILFQPQKNVSSLRAASTRHSLPPGPGSSFSQGSFCLLLCYALFITVLFFVYYCFILQPNHSSSLSQGALLLVLVIIVFITVLFFGLPTAPASIKVNSFLTVIF